MKAEQEMNLVECFNLARWDTEEQARYVAKELTDEWDGEAEWVTFPHHHHFHVVMKGGAP